VRGSATLWPLLLLLTACATGSVELKIPGEVVGTVSGPRYTGWMQDLCNEGQVTKSLPGCAPLGVAVYDMEIYKATVRNVRTPEGTKVSSKMVVGLMSHALRHDYRTEAHLYLERAPENFRVETGIEYLARMRVTPNTSLERTRER
jgi:hypothetical protein